MAASPSETWCSPRRSSSTTRVRSGALHHAGTLEPTDLRQVADQGACIVEKRGCNVVRFVADERIGHLPRLFGHADERHQLKICLVLPAGLATDRDAAVDVRRDRRLNGQHSDGPRLPCVHLGDHPWEGALQIAERIGPDARYLRPLPYVACQ